MNKKIRTPEVEQLFKGILCLQNVEECYEFFEDICTINELLSLSQRFDVASMLREKKTCQQIIESATRPINDLDDRLTLEGLLTWYEQQRHMS